MRISALMITIIAATVTVSVAQAETKWQKNHPERTKEADRRANQRARIDQGVKNGTITKAEAKSDRQAIRAEGQTARAEAKANGGHLTPAEAKANEQSLNASSKNIYEQKHDGQAPPSSGAAPAAPAAPATGSAGQ